MNSHSTPIYSFCTLDEIIARNSVNFLSLNPAKTSATSFVELGTLIAEKTTDTKLIIALESTLTKIVYSQLENFPENIFWDFDFMVSSVLRQSLLAGNEAFDFLKSFGEKMVNLTNLFGIKTEIHFRYVHDFVYGFTWAKWVQKEPQTRAHIEPFSMIYLDYLLVKGQEIIHSLSLNQLPAYKLSETGYRNPFTFSREPEDERRLLIYLAKKQLIPVAAWNWNTQPVWNKPFQRIRESCSIKLNIRQQTY